MLFQNKPKRNQRILIALMVLIAACAVQAQEFTTSKGMKIKFLKQDDLGFIHAQIVVYYHFGFNNPALPSLTATNIFSRDYNPSGSPVLNTLRSLGNDFEIQNRPDSLLIKINFLPGKVQLFTQFLKNLFRYKPFYQTYSGQSYNYTNLEQTIQKNLVESKRQYWQDLKKEKHWKKKVAMQIAYSRLFPNHSLGRILVTPDTLNRATLPSIRSFYRRNYTPQNTKVILKGNLHPGQTRGLFELEFKSFKKPDKPLPQIDIPVPTNKREIIILHIDSIDSPLIFWINTIPPVSSKHHLETLLLNDFIYSYPLGTLPRQAYRNGIRLAALASDQHNHLGASIICNTIGVKFNEIEKVIIVADSELRKLENKGITRREILNISSYFLGKCKVKTEHFDNDVETKIGTFNFQTGYNSSQQLPNLLQQVSTTSIRRVIGIPQQSIIVIVGNSKLVSDQINILKKPIIYKIF